jgi:sorbitol/mannitol transport system substrate-binding protein
MDWRRRHWGVLVGATALSLAATACAGAGGSSSNGGSKTIHVLMVNNPQMVDLEHLTPQYFTKKTGIKVDFTVLPEDDLRDKASQEFSSQAGQYDLATLSNFEIPFYSKDGWLAPMNDFIAKDSGFNQADILKPIAASITGSGGQVYGEPFYGESSFLMYRKDLFAEKGLTMPANPTWQQVATLAAKLKGAKPGMAGICLRGQPGWGENLAPLTTVVNTFGGTWFDKSWNAQVDAQPFENATNFYVNLVRKDGEAGAAQSGFTECLNDFEQGKTAMWYDATSGAGSLEASGSPVAGKVGYAPAPVVNTKSSGWLYTWAWAIEKASKHQSDAWKFISWASGKSYISLVGQKYGWAQVPPGTRLDVLEPELPEDGVRLRPAHADGDRQRRPEQPGRSAASHPRRPVRRHPAVHRLRHTDLPAHRGRDRRQDDGYERAEPGATPGPDRGKPVQGPLAGCRAGFSQPGRTRRNARHPWFWPSGSGGSGGYVAPRCSPR